MPLKLAYKHAFGVHGPVRNNVEIITAQDEHGSPKDHLLHPVGQHLALLRLEDHEMKFLSLKGVKEKGAREIVSIALAPNRKVVAACERCVAAGSRGRAGADAGRPRRRTRPPRAAAGRRPAGAPAAKPASAAAADGACRSGLPHPDGDAAAHDARAGGRAARDVRVHGRLEEGGDGGDEAEKRASSCGTGTRRSSSAPPTPRSRACARRPSRARARSRRRASSCGC